jgi:dihydroxyacid dehydratase/phosphogluconate dehydratase
MKKGLTAYGDPGFSLFLRTAFLKAMGYSDEALDRPVVGITNTYSDYNSCHATVPELVAAIKRGVQQAGGLPMAFPTVTLHESFAHPTSRCCQSNANRSPKSAGSGLSGRKLTPFGKSGRSVMLEDISAV